MHQTYKLQQATPLKLLIETEDPVGVGRYKGMEVVPNTPTACKEWGIPISNTVNIPKYDVTNTSYSTLRTYQQEDCLFLLARKNAGVFNEQRTGKTPTSLVSLHIKGCTKVLIVCPASMVLVWQQEFLQWIGSHCSVVQGTPSQKAHAINTWTHGLVVGYETLRIDSYLSAIVKTKDVDAVIIDEAHRIRNYKTATAKAVFQLSKIPHKLALSGTPVLNKQEEIYSILHFLYPKVFTGYWRFIDYYFEKEYKDIYIGGRARQTTEVGRLRKPRELQEFLDNMSTQRKRKDVMPWLPEKDKQTVYFWPTKEQKQYLHDLHKWFEVEHITTQGVLDSLIRERQICLAPELLSLGGTSPKLDWIKQYLVDYPEKRVIIFSKFTQWLELLHSNLPQSELYTGQTAPKKRQQLKESFQAGSLPVLLIQIDAGKEGLTLDKADTIIFTDKFPPIGDIEQAEDRFVATREERVKRDQVIYTLVTRNTYEEQIVYGLEQRSSEVDIINNYAKYLEGRTHGTSNRI